MGQGAADLIEALGSTLGELASTRGAGLGERDHVLELHRCLGQLQAVVASSVAQLELSGEAARDGATTAASWVAVRCKLPIGTARRELRLGRALGDLPLASSAFLAGEIGASQFEELARLAGGRCRQAVSRSEKLLVDQAQRLSFEDFQRCCAYFEQLADPDGSDGRDEARRARREVSLVRSIGGTFLGRMVLDPISGEIVSGELERLERQLFDSDRAAAAVRLGRAPLPHELERSARQRRADALVEMATRSAALQEGAARPGPLFSVLVDWPTLSGRICELASGQPVSPGSLVRYLDASILERAVFGPYERIEVSARRRLFDGATRHAIELRDRRCSDPFCDEPAERCQVDHLVPYDYGGLTTQENGRLLCPRHNRAAYRRWLALSEDRRRPLAGAQRAAAEARGVVQDERDDRTAESVQCGPASGDDLIERDVGCAPPAGSSQH